jgi:hypothetical protein
LVFSGVYFAACVGREEGLWSRTVCASKPIFFWGDVAGIEKRRRARALQKLERCGALGKFNESESGAARRNPNRVRRLGT